MSAENSTAERPPAPGRPFPKGVSGNPGGRPRRIRDLEIAIREKHVGGPVLAVLEKLQKMAVSGDVAAARVYLERVIGPPRPKEDPIDAMRSKADGRDLLEDALSVARDHVAAIRSRADSEGICASEASVLVDYVRAGVAAVKAEDPDATTDEETRMEVTNFVVNDPNMRQRVLARIAEQES